METNTRKVGIEVERFNICTNEIDNSMANQ